MSPQARRISWSATIQRHLPIHHVRHIAPLAEKLHHLLALPCQRGPSRFRFWVLFKPSDFFSIEDEINFVQLALRSSHDGVSFSSQNNRFGVVNESLSPNFNKCFFKGRFHLAPESVPHS